MVKQSYGVLFLFLCARILYDFRLYAARFPEALWDGGILAPEVQARSPAFSILVDSGLAAARERWLEGTRAFRAEHLGAAGVLVLPAAFRLLCGHAGAVVCPGETTAFPSACRITLSDEFRVAVLREAIFLGSIRCLEMAVGP